MSNNTPPTPSKTTNEMTNANKVIKRRPYPDKYRQERAKLIRKTRPWERATGPKTKAGKAASSGNARKHGLRSAEINHLRSLLRLQARAIKQIRGKTPLPDAFSLGKGGKICY